jgi:hypothetical protein
MSSPCVDPENEVRAAFQEIADAIGAKMQKGPEHCVEIPGNGVVLRVCWEAERTKGVFVTLFAKDDADREYGLPHLVAFESAPQVDPFEEKAADGRAGDAKAAAHVAKKYAVRYLLGDPKRFSEFRDYVVDWVEKNMPSLPNVGTNRRVRAEWI